MAIIGFNFTKILVERKNTPKGKVDIKNNVSVTSVEGGDLSVGSSKHRVVTFSFEFTSDYSPEVGQILLTGDLLYLDEPQKQEELVKNWKKNKQVPKEVMTEILNNILSRCNVEALFLSRDVNLPPPIRLPKVQ